jgi:4-hydroxymandelate oxidase
VSELPSTLPAFEAEFRERLPAGPLAYFSGGAGDELTLNANSDAWRRMSITPEVMIDVSERDSSISLLGQARPNPLIVAPTAYHRLAHPEGEIATARGAALAGCTYTLSTLATTRPAEVSQGAADAHRWFQVYVFRDRAVTRELIAEAADSGFSALVLTVDLPVLGRRDREIQSGFTVGDAASVPGVAAAGGSGSISMQDTADLIDPSLTWRDVEKLAAEVDLPLLVKGVLRPDDARFAIESGAAGVIVSNHGGRQLDTVPATGTVLPSIVDAVQETAAVLVDGGIRRGTDILKALCLGADSVLVGRPALWGLAAAGTDGVRAVLEILLDEFDRALALSGCPKASELKGRSDLVQSSQAGAL